MIGGRVQAGGEFSGGGAQPGAQITAGRVQAGGKPLGRGVQAGRQLIGGRVQAGAQALAGGVLFVANVTNLAADRRQSGGQLLTDLMLVVAEVPDLAVGHGQAGVQLGMDGRLVLIQPVAQASFNPAVLLGLFVDPGGELPGAAAQGGFLTLGPGGQFVGGLAGGEFLFIQARAQGGIGLATLTDLLVEPLFEQRVALGPGGLLVLDSSPHAGGGLLVGLAEGGELRAGVVSRAAALAVYLLEPVGQSGLSCLSRGRAGLDLLMQGLVFAAVHVLQPDQSLAVEVLRLDDGHQVGTGGQGLETLIDISSNVRASLLHRVFQAAAEFCLGGGLAGDEPLDFVGGSLAAIAHRVQQAADALAVLLQPGDCFSDALAAFGFQGGDGLGAGGAGCDSGDSPAGLGPASLGLVEQLLELGSVAVEILEHGPGAGIVLAAQVLHFIGPGGAAGQPGDLLFGALAAAGDLFHGVGQLRTVGTELLAGRLPVGPHIGGRQRSRAADGGPAINTLQAGVGLLVVGRQFVGHGQPGRGGDRGGLAGLSQVDHARKGPGLSEPFLFEHAEHDRCIDLGGMLPVGRDQGVVAQPVDHSRDAVGHPVELVQGLGGEQARAGVARDAQTAADVFSGLLGVECRQMEAAEEPLLKLTHVRPAETLAQLGLAEDADLEQLGVVGFEVAQHAQGFEALIGQILGLVQQHHHAAVTGELLQEVILQQPGQMHVAGRRGNGDLQFRADRGQQLLAGQVGLGNHRGGRPPVNSTGEHPADQGLARAHFSGDQHEPLAVQGRVLERREGLLVIRGAVIERRIGGVVEGRTGQAKVSAVHRASPACSTAGSGGYRTAPGAWRTVLCIGLPVMGLELTDGPKKQWNLVETRH